MFACMACIDSDAIFHLPISNFGETMLCPCWRTTFLQLSVKKSNTIMKRSLMIIFNFFSKLFCIETSQVLFFRSIPVVECGGVLTAPSGLISSPGFEAGNYNHSLNCLWTFFNPNHMNSSVKFSVGHLHLDRWCRDYILVQGGEVLRRDLFLIINLGSLLLLYFLCFILYSQVFLLAKPFLNILLASLMFWHLDFC